VLLRAETRGVCANPTIPQEELALAWVQIWEQDSVKPPHISAIWRNRSHIRTGLTSGLLAQRADVRRMAFPAVDVDARRYLIEDG
jgi:hypothetical protein